MTNYNFCDIVLINFPHTHYLRVSKRHALVLYDAKDCDVVVARITSQIYETESDYKIVKWKESGLILELHVRLSKIAAIGKIILIKNLAS